MIYARTERSKERDKRNFMRLEAEVVNVIVKYMENRCKRNPRASIDLYEENL